MAYKILCLTSGDYIKMTRHIAYQQLCIPGIPQDVKLNMYPLSMISTWDYAKFDTEEAARWFVSHRLVYNPRRKDARKLHAMKELFEFNNVPGWQTCKIEFEIDIT